MTAPRVVLVVEDEPAISDLLSFHLRSAGFEPVVTASGYQALDIVQRRQPCLVLLDIMLPDLDGLQILTRIRQDRSTARTPVILLTARAEEGDRVTGLEIGADDYVTKPFSPRELMLRATKLVENFRTMPNPGEAPRAVLTFGELEIDEDRFRVAVSGKAVDVSATEMRLLTELLKTKGIVMSRAQILQSAWGYMPNVTERTVDTHIKRLRQKLGVASNYIETVRGVGYRWLESPPDEATLLGK